MLAVAIAAFLASPATSPKDRAAKPVCQDGGLRPVTSRPRAGLHRLDQEPPARQVYTVLRTENGCSRPVYVNDRVIGGTRR